MASFLLEPLSRVAAIAGAVASGNLAGAAISRDPSRVMAAAITVAASTALATTLFSLGFIVRRSISEKVTHLVDVEIGQLTSGITTVEHLERPDYLDRVELLRRDPQGIGNVINSLIFLMSTLAMTVATITVLLRIQPLLVLIPVSGLLSLWTGARSQRRWRAIEAGLAPVQRLGNHLFQMATNAAVGKELRVFGLRAEISARHSKTWEAQQAATLRGRARDEAESAVSSLIQIGVWLAGVALVTDGAFRGRQRPGDVVIVVFLGAIVGGVLTALVGNLQWVGGNLRTAERFLWLRDYARSQRARDLATKTLPDRLHDGIRLKSVSFTYPGSAQPALTNVDLHLPAGAVVALVGENGAGKTTLVKLLCRFYDPTE
ncbi:MAG: ATP-binding cassette domain-containing protein, partial [Candidatus Dormibacteria bacterium]